MSPSNCLFEKILMLIFWTKIYAHVPNLLVLFSGDYVFEINDPSGESELLFTENETNMRRMSEPEGVLPHDEGYKDAFHNYVISGDKGNSVVNK